MNKDLITLSVIRGFLQAIIDNGHFDKYINELHQCYSLIDDVIEKRLNEMKAKELN
jgi:hypothetical protein